MLNNESIVKLLNFYKLHKQDNDVLKDVYDGVIWKKLFNDKITSKCDVQLGISLCYDGLDVFQSGNNKGKIKYIFHNIYLTNRINYSFIIFNIKFTIRVEK